MNTAKGVRYIAKRFGMHSALFLITLLILNVTLFAVEVKWEIHPKWRTGSCVDFGYSLDLNNANGKLQLRSLSDSAKAIRPIFVGKFIITNDAVVLDFGDFKSYYYLKRPYEPASDNVADSLNENERGFVCDTNQLVKIDDRVYVKDTTLFLLKLEGVGNDAWAVKLLTDLQSACFAASK